MGVDTKISAIMAGGAKLASPLEAIGDIARAMICAAPGHRLMIADFSGIESRVLAWISGQQSKLDQWAKFDATRDLKDDPYFILGRACGQPEETARATGKVADLAFGYVGGVGAWQRLAPEDDAADEATIRRYRQAWRNAHPRTVQFWHGIDRAAIAAVRNPGMTCTCRGLRPTCNFSCLRITLPSGRALAYPFPRVEAGKFGGPRVTFKDTSGGKWGDCRFGAGAYGGLWTENIVQAIARDLLAAALVRLEAAGYPIVLHVHDEVVCEVPNGFGNLEDFRRLVTALPDWAEGLPIAAKAREGERFSKPDTTPAAAGPPQPFSAPSPWNDATGGDELDESAKNSSTISTPPPDETSGDDPLAELLDGAAGDDQPPDTGGDALGAAAEGAAPSWVTPDISDDETAAGNGDDQCAGNGYAAGERPWGSNVAEYIYRAADGSPYLRVVRTSAKQFPQYHWNDSRWLLGKPAGPKIPYRLPELIAASAETPVFIAEGEKDANNVAALGLIATTNSEGAGKGKWTADLNKWFKGRQTAYILEDNDEDGRRHVREVADALRDIVAEVRIVSFTELPPKEDVSYWLRTGGTREQLFARAKAAPRSLPNGYILVRASDITPRAMDWLWRGHILRGSQELLTGIPGGGKSQIHCAFVAYVTTGGAWPDGCSGAPPGNVIMLTAEDCLDQTIVPRLIAAGADRERVFILKKIRKDDKERMFLLGEDLAELEKVINQVGDVRLITIDPITAYMGHKLDSHRATDVRGQLGPLADLAERADVALSAITHPPKHTSQRAIDHFIGSQAFIAAARIGHMAIEEMDEDEHGNRLPTGRSLFTNPKNNVSRKMSTLAYRIVEKQLDGGIKAAYVTWEEIVDITADQAVAAAASSKNKEPNGATVFLLDILANGPVPIKLLEERAAVRGFSKDQLDRAKKKLRVAAFKAKDVKDGRWFWALPQYAPAETKD
jgi:hypothetical protein